MGGVPCRRLALAASGRSSELGTAASLAVPHRDSRGLQSGPTALQPGAS